MLLTAAPEGPIWGKKTKIRLARFLSAGNGYKAVE